MNPLSLMKSTGVHYQLQFNAFMNYTIFKCTALISIASPYNFLHCPTLHHTCPTLYCTDLHYTGMSRNLVIAFNYHKLHWSQKPASLMQKSPIDFIFHIFQGILVVSFMITQTLYIVLKLIGSHQRKIVHCHYF